MLTQQSMVYFAPDTWHGLWQPRQQLMQDFSRHGNKVLYVEKRRYLRSAVAGWRNGAITLNDLKRPLLQRVNENLYTFHYPEWAPISGKMPLNQITTKIRSIYLRKAMRSLGIEQPIVWFAQPELDLLDAAPSPRLRLYHILDEYSAYAGQTADQSKRIQEIEPHMIKHVDAVFVVSKTLYESKRKYHPNTYLVPNGVDYEAYTRALNDAQSPAELECIPHPRIGYSGLIGDKLNMPMLHDLVLTRPHLSFVFIGEVRLTAQATIWEQMLKLPNVHYLGKKDKSQVPYYLKGFQVGLMPYVQNRHASYIDPIKLYDYLAAGIAVVSTDIQALDGFRQHVHVAESPEDFIPAVDAALANVGPTQFASRRAIAAQHTWEARAQRMSEVIQERLEMCPQS